MYGQCDEVEIVHELIASAIVLEPCKIEGNLGVQSSFWHQALHFCHREDQVVDSWHLDAQFPQDNQELAVQP